MTQTRKLFGTDGIRGEANSYPMTSEVAMALGKAITSYFQKKHQKDGKRPLVIVGKDTRLSCYMLELAISSGICSQGGRVILTGPLPTPGVSFVTQSMRADAGVMISASHNPFSDNGIKIFDADGNKLPDSVELEIEKMVLNPEEVPTQRGDLLGRAERLDEVIGRYIVFAKSALDPKCSLNGMRIVVDCANGAAYKVGPMIFEELGAEVIRLGVSPNGKNINEGCGALHPEHCAKAVLQYRADIGICLDGDSDRLIVVDENGTVVDGDKIIGLFVKYFYDLGTISDGDEIVGTAMTNLGVENYIKAMGLNFYRTDVGDRYISKRMKEVGSVIGGEPSGHIILKEYSNTGDGIIASLKLLECIKYYKKTIKKLTDEIELYPQLLHNVKVKKKTPLNKVEKIVNKINKCEKILGDDGRLLVRYSGTELLLRIMFEGVDRELIEKLAKELKDIVVEELCK